ncbi:MAG: DUF6644 family protein [Pseudohongiellaceae bacterium]
MVFQDFWLQLELLPWVQHLAATIWFPVVNSLHVLSVCLMLGLLLMADLRLLGNAMLDGPASLALKALLPLTVLAFLAAMVTGLALFMTRAATHVTNPAFQWKMVLLVLAGINVWVFHQRLYPCVVAAGGGRVMTAGVRASAALSLVLWSGVMLSGRWIGHVFG